jgi:hypothetical protein
MRNSKSFPVIFAFFMFSPIFTFAQVNVRIHKPPPNQLKTENLWWVDLTNAGSGRPVDKVPTYDVYLYGEISRENELIFRGSTNDFKLPPGTKRVLPNEIKSLRDTWYKEEYEKYLVRTGGVPAGNYNVCVSVKDSKTNRELGRQCIKITVMLANAPRLISPKGDLKVKVKRPIFTWTRPTPVPASMKISYKVKIVEVYEGQTKEEAIRSNIPVYEGVIKNISFQYPVKARTLDINKTYAWQVQAIDETGIPFGEQQGMSEIWQFNPKDIYGDKVVPRLIPEVLKIGEFTLKDITYNANSTIDSLSGHAESFFLQKSVPGHFGGPVFIWTEVNFLVDFNNLKARWTTGDTAEVIVGEIIEDFSSPLEVKVEGYSVLVYDIHLLPDSAISELGVKVTCLCDTLSCNALELEPFAVRVSPKIDLYKELPVKERGPFVLGETGILIKSTDKVIVDLSRTITPSDVGISFNHGETIEQSAMKNSNTGFLYGKYTFTNGKLNSSGFSVEFQLASPFNFAPINPMGFDVNLASGYLKIDSCKVKNGKFTNSLILIRKGEKGVYKADGNQIAVAYDSLLVDSKLNIYGDVRNSEEMRWGGFGITWDVGQFRLKGAPAEFVSPVKGDSFKVYSAGELDSLSGLTIKYNKYHYIFSIYSTDTENPIKISDGILGGYFNIGSFGISGILHTFNDSRPRDSVLLGNKNLPQYIAKTPFITKLGRYSRKQKSDSLMDIEFKFTGNSTFDSDMGGQFKIPTECDFYSSIKDTCEIRPPFKDMEVTSTASFVGGNVAFTDTLQLPYWGVGITSKRGVVSVKLGEIVYTNADIYEPVHFSKGFNIIWGEMLADGSLGEFYFNHDAAHQKFDGFPITLDSAALSEYDPNRAGELVVRSGVHFSFFGETDTLITVHDAIYSKNIDPYYGRLVSIEPYSFTLYRKWGSKMSIMDFPTIMYDSAVQNGFKGTGLVDIEFMPDAHLPATIRIDSMSASICMSDHNVHQLFFGVGNFSAVDRTWGCIYIEGDELKRMVTGGALYAGASAVSLLPAQAGGGVEWKTVVTPTMTQFTCHGLMYIDIGLAHAEVNGRIRLTHDRSIPALDGEVYGHFNMSDVIAGGVEAEGQVTWHFGSDYFMLQGRVAVDIYSWLGGGGMEGGVFIGKDAPSSQAWVLLDEDGRFGIDITRLPVTLTGVYGYGEIGWSERFLYGVLEGEIIIHVGLGLFVQSAGPAMMGDCGIYIRGEILWGLVSASALANLQFFAAVPPDPSYFEGTIKLKGCVAYIFCASIKLTAGISSEDGFYLEY